MPEKDLEYRTALINSIKCLRNTQLDIFTQLVNVAMSGELKEINDQFTIGESLNFDEEMFKNCNDLNVQLLIKVLDEMKATTESMININAIGQDEIGDIDVD